MSPDPATGLVLADRFEVRELIARGGVGSVWRASDRLLERDVAAKFLHPHLAEDPETRERFRVEALAAARIRSAHAADVYDARREDDLAYLIMELIEGPTLKRVLDSGPLDAVQTAAVGIQVASALQEGHDRAIVHRDVKPSNIMLTTRGLIKVVDFGLARAFESSVETSDGALYGSPIYVSPEQLLENPVTGQADVFGLGVVLWEAVTGRRPFHGDHIQAILLNRFREQLPNPSDLDRKIPRRLGNAIEWATRSDPGERCPSAAALAAELERIAGHRPEDVTTALLAERSWRS